MENNIKNVINYIDTPPNRHVSDALVPMFDHQIAAFVQHDKWCDLTADNHLQVGTIMQIFASHLPQVVQKVNEDHRKPQYRFNLIMTNLVCPYIFHAHL